uniref:Uncharacterized protein n=1 Tax=Tanacetum cinerariifolium TaxID=118510 RepID=A0A6L2MSL5_TANCI|nr:hypothetical protein [Tanacetum cinerariifolium]
MELQLKTTQTVSTLKLPVLKTREYDLWSMRIEQYLTFTDHALWEVIVNGDLVSSVAYVSAEAIKNRFGGNKESKKMQKTILKQNYENFVASSHEGLDKTYDRFQKLISQLEIHGELISQEDVDLKLLRSLPSAWNNISLIMRNKSDLDTLSMDDLYNNLKVYESEIKCQSSSSLNSQNVAFVSSDNTSSTNETVNTAHGVSAASYKDQAFTASYADDVMFSFFSNQSNAPHLDNEYVKQIDTDDLKEMDLKWQVEMLTMRAEEELTNFALMAHTSSSSSSDSELEKALKEKDDLKLKLEKFEASSKNLTKLIDSQISATDMTGISYDGHVNESEVLNNVVDSYESDGDDNQINDSVVFKSKMNETITSVPKIKTNASKTSNDSLEKPNIVRFSAPIIEDWESDSKDENVFESKEVKKTVKPSLEKIKFVNARNTTVENENKAENIGILTKSGQVPVNAAKQSFHRAASSVSAARRVNIASRPNVNNASPITYSYFKAHLLKRPFNKKSAAKTNNFNEKVNTAKVNNVTTAGTKAVVSVVEGNRNNAVKSSACWI